VEAVGVRLRPGPEPAELELAAECMVVGSGDKVAEAGLLVVERPVAAAEQLRVGEWWPNVDIPVVFIGLTLVNVPVSHKVASLLRIPLFTFIVFVRSLFLTFLH